MCDGCFFFSHTRHLIKMRKSKWYFCGILFVVENSCARTDAVFTPYPGFKSHVKGKNSGRSAAVTEHQYIHDSTLITMKKWKLNPISWLNISLACRVLHAECCMHVFWFMATYQILHSVCRLQCCTHLYVTTIGIDVVRLTPELQPLFMFLWLGSHTSSKHLRAPDS